MKENLEDEIWKDVPEYEGLYQVSSFGRVRSLPKEWVGGNGGIRKHNGLILKGGKTVYKNVGLRKEGKAKTFNIHKLVSMVFLGHIPDGTQNIVVDHIDGNKLNNNVSNLQLITQRENASKDKSGYTSKHIGVRWHKNTSKWCSDIRINDKNIHLGLFIDEKEASEMYEHALSNIDKFDGDAKEFRDYLNRKKNC